MSSDSQLEGDGFPRQIQACRDYARNHNLKIVKIFREEAVTGTEETMRRPAWSALMAGLFKDGVRTILIEKLDRLSRALLIQEHTIAELGKQGFNLISAHEGAELMSTDPNRVIFRQLMGAISQYDKTQIVLKLAAARRRKRLATGAV